MVKTSQSILHLLYTNDYILCDYFWASRAVTWALKFKI